MTINDDGHNSEGLDGCLKEPSEADKVLQLLGGKSNKCPPPSPHNKNNNRAPNRINTVSLTLTSKFKNIKKSNFNFNFNLILQLRIKLKN